MGEFDPPGKQPVIALQSPQARRAIEKEITDLLNHHGKVAPAMMEIGLRDPRYGRLRREISTIVEKSKSIYIKGNCVRAGNRSL